jgi:phosphoribosylaminoimidazole (AIR) synthetase
MGVPYALVCEETDVENLLQTATAHWYVAKVIGEITEEGWMQIQNVGVGKTTITI